MLYENYDESWDAFLTPDIRKMLDDIENDLGDDYTPKKELILRFLKTNLNNVKVVILGQDPYFQPLAATGRSFEVGTIQSWDDSFRNVSLKNIVRLVYRSYFEEEFKHGIDTYKKILEKKAEGKFLIKAPHDWFDSLEKQGVLFLNSSFSTKINQANAHKELWICFSRRLIDFLNTLPIYWFVWGNEARKKTDFIDETKKFVSNHPMLCQIQKKEDFLNNQCFLKTKDIINWLG